MGPFGRAGRFRLQERGGGLPDTGLLFNFFFFCSFLLEVHFRGMTSGGSRWRYTRKRAALGSRGIIELLLRSAGRVHPPLTWASGGEGGERLVRCEVRNSLSPTPFLRSSFHNC